MELLFEEKNLLNYWVCKYDVNAMIKNIDTGSVFIIIITLILFGVALFTKGITHDLLLEAGVFLVSVKLIMMSYKNSIHSQKLEKELSEINVF